MLTSGSGAGQQQAFDGKQVGRTKRCWAWWPLCMYCQYGGLQKLTKLGARMLLLLPAWRPATTSLDVDVGMCWQPLSLQTHLLDPDQRRADVCSCPCSDGNLVASLLSHRLGITQVGCQPRAAAPAWTALS